MLLIMTREREDVWTEEAAFEPGDDEPMWTRSAAVIEEW
jgi:hypothetical protein